LNKWPIVFSFITGLTGHLEGRELICSCDEVIHSLLSLLSDPSEVIQKDAWMTLVNLTADAAGAQKIFAVSTTVQVIASNFGVFVPLITQAISG
jgi:hypothetical protein